MLPFNSNTFRSSALDSSGVPDGSDWLPWELVRDYSQWQSAETVAKHYVHYSRASQR